jgi:hypothetical protein
MYHPAIVFVALLLEAHKKQCPINDRKKDNDKDKDNDRYWQLEV